MAKSIPHKPDVWELANHTGFSTDEGAAGEENIDIMLDLPTGDSDLLEDDHASPATTNAQGDENLGESMTVRHQLDAKCVILCYPFGALSRMRFTCYLDWS